MTGGGVIVVICGEGGGYVAGSAELLDTVTKVLESNSSCVSTISQVAAEAALDGPQDCVGEMNEAYLRRRDAVVDILREADLFISEPKAAFYCMADVSPSGMSSRDFAFILRRFPPRICVSSSRKRTRLIKKRTAGSGSQPFCWRNA